jgi:hypothetical protein
MWSTPAPADSAREKSNARSSRSGYGARSSVRKGERADHDVDAAGLALLPNLEPNE